MQLTRRGAARLTSLTILTGIALTGCNHSTTTDTGSGSSIGAATGGAVATIKTPKGKTLTISQPEFYAQLQGFVPNPSPQTFAPIGQSAGRLELAQMLQNLMLEGLAEDQGLAPTDAEVNTQYNNFKMIQDSRSIKPVEQALADAGLTSDIVKDLQIKPQLAQVKLLTKGATITDTDIQNYYNTNKNKAFTKPARVHIKKIAVSTLPEAQAIAKAINGGQTFESQVSKSLDQSTPDGDFPQWIPTDPAPPGSDVLVKPLIATAAGQITPPIAVPGRAGATYWIVKVVEKKLKETLPLDQVKDLIRAQLLQQKAQADPMAQQSLQQSLRDFQTHAQISIPAPQYASLIQELNHPPAPAPSGGPPFTPPAGKP